MKFTSTGDGTVRIVEQPTATSAPTLTLGNCSRRDSTSCIHAVVPRYRKGGNRSRDEAQQRSACRLEKEMEFNADVGFDPTPLPSPLVSTAYCRSLIPSSAELPRSKTHRVLKIVIVESFVVMHEVTHRQKSVNGNLLSQCDAQR